MRGGGPPPSPPAGDVWWLATAGVDCTAFCTGIGRYCNDGDMYSAESDYFTSSSAIASMIANAHSADTVDRTCSAYSYPNVLYSPYFRPAFDECYASGATQVSEMSCSQDPPDNTYRRVCYCQIQSGGRRRRLAERVFSWIGKDLDEDHVPAHGGVWAHNPPDNDLLAHTPPPDTPPDVAERDHRW